MVCNTLSNFIMYSLNLYWSLKEGQFSSQKIQVSEFSCLVCLHKIWRDGEMEWEIDFAFLGEETGFENGEGALKAKQVCQSRLIVVIGLSAVRLQVNQMTSSSNEEEESRQSKFLLRNGAIDWYLPSVLMLSLNWAVVSQMGISTWTRI